MMMTSLKKDAASGMAGNHEDIYALSHSFLQLSLKLMLYMTGISEAVLKPFLLILQT